MNFSKDTSGFTLVELMIVISIIVTLLGIGFFPYSYYMERARVEGAIDSLSQEWIIAHEDVRNGRTIGTGTHTNIYIDMGVGSGSIDFITSTGSVSEGTVYKKYSFEGKIQILEFTGSIIGSPQSLIYHISPPSATGAFSTGTISPEMYLSGVIMKIGYPDATLESRRARNILLRPYYD